MVRGKFTLVSMKQHAGSSARSLEFAPQYDPNLPEDNPPALAQLELGKAYYLDLTPVPEAEPA